MLFRPLPILLCCLCVATPALAQHAFELVGVRAMGMAGAFVGVADDASAVYWNPAGLLNGPAVGATIGWDRFQLGNQAAQPSPGPRSQSGLLNSLGGWPLGLSYAKFRTSTLTAGLDGQTRSDTLETREFGVTLVQSIAQGLVLGSTIKYVRESFASVNAVGSTVEAALDAVADLDPDSHGAFDLDVGIMADMEKVRVGVVLKNLKPRTFVDLAGTAITLERHARLGVAVLPTSGLTLAMDVDLDTVDLRDGLRRNFALGGEGRLSSRLVVRGGVRWSLTGARRLVTAAGGSVAVRRGLWVDGYLNYGAADTARGFGVALRAAY